MDARKQRGAAGQRFQEQFDAEGAGQQPKGKQQMTNVGPNQGNQPHSFGEGVTGSSEGGGVLPEQLPSKQQM